MIFLILWYYEIDLLWYYFEGVWCNYRYPDPRRVWQGGTVLQLMTPDPASRSNSGACPKPYVLLRKTNMSLPPKLCFRCPWFPYRWHPKGPSGCNIRGVGLEAGHQTSNRINSRQTWPPNIDHLQMNCKKSSHSEHWKILKIFPEIVLRFDVKLWAGFWLVRLLTSNPGPTHRLWGLLTSNPGPMFDFYVWRQTLGQTLTCCLCLTSNLGTNLDFCIFDVKPSAKHWLFDFWRQLLGGILTCFIADVKPSAQTRLFDFWCQTLGRLVIFLMFDFKPWAEFWLFDLWRQTPRPNIDFWDLWRQTSGRILTCLIFDVTRWAHNHVLICAVKLWAEFGLVWFLTSNLGPRCEAELWTMEK